jgi:hypothetical protein
MSEEYAPSVLIADRTGKVLTRYVPISLLSKYERVDLGYQVRGLLPPIVTRMRLVVGVKHAVLWVKLRVINSPILLFFFGSD